MTGQHSNTSFRYYLRVRYGECDAQKVVFNARYGEYADLAASEFLRALGWFQAFLDGPLDYQLVKQTIEWRAPARFDQVLELSVRTLAVGTTSFTLRTEFRLADAAAVIATTETVYVVVDAKALSKAPVPAAFREALLVGADAVVDHAGRSGAQP